MTEQEKFSYEGVQMGYGDVIVAFGFYVSLVIRLATLNA